MTVPDPDFGKVTEFVIPCDPSLWFHVVESYYVITGLSWIPMSKVTLFKPQTTFDGWLHEMVLPDSDFGEVAESVTPWDPSYWWHVVESVHVITGRSWIPMSHDYALSVRRRMAAWSTTRILLICSAFHHYDCTNCGCAIVLCDRNESLYFVGMDVHYFCLVTLRVQWHLEFVSILEFPRFAIFQLSCFHQAGNLCFLPGLCY